MDEKLQDLTIPAWRESDYETSTPFDWLYQYKDDKFMLAQLREKIKKQAGAVGVKNFLSLWKAYLETRNSQNKSYIVGVNSTQFDGQPFELVCGDYTCDDFGVTTVDRYGFEVVVCTHPIMPVQRLINIDTGVVKIELAFKRSKRWRRIIVDKLVISSAQKIVELSGSGIEVTSENARDMVRYLSTIGSLNYDTIPETSSVGRLGWIAEHGFSPYVDDVTFDGDVSCRKIFDACKQVGSFDTWLQCVKQIRADNAIARMMIDASFASALVSPCDALPFFFHVWGFSGTSKTVALMVAASVWADPSSGAYVQTFNSTSTGLEIKSGICNSLPLCIDELQSIKDKKKFDNIIYMLAEGIGKTRGAKGGGTQHTYTWANCIISTGEMPISNDVSGAGAVNRVIEVDCGESPLVENPREVVKTVKRNYGWAGKLFAESLQQDDILTEAKDLYSQYSVAFDTLGATEKQSMAAALIMAVDVLADKYIFESNTALTVSDILPYLSTREGVDQNAHAYDWLLDLVATNPLRFDTNQFGDYVGECWGFSDDEYLYIIKSVFDNKMNDAGYNPASFLSWAKRRNLILCDKQGKSTVTKRFGDVLSRCVCIRKQKDDVV
jgi:hypothetical protein